MLIPCKNSPTEIYHGRIEEYRKIGVPELIYWRKGNYKEAIRFGVEEAKRLHYFLMIQELPIPYFNFLFKAFLKVSMSYLGHGKKHPV